MLTFDLKQSRASDGLTTSCQNKWRHGLGGFHFKHGIETDLSGTLLVRPLKSSNIEQLLESWDYSLNSLSAFFGWTTRLGFICM